MFSIDNKDTMLSQELEKVLTPEAMFKIFVKAFSISAFQELQKNLQSIKEMRSIYVKPTPGKQEEAPLAMREFHIAKPAAARGLYNNELEIYLRNQMNQRGVAKNSLSGYAAKPVLKAILATSAPPN